MAEEAISSAAIRGLQLGERGSVGLAQIGGYIFEEMRRELRFPESLRTYKRMSYDPTIKSANNVLDIMIGRVDWEFQVPKDASEDAKDAAEFLNWCMDNMEGQTWGEFINEVGSYRQYGFHVAEKVYTRVRRGQYQGRYKWQHLPTRSQDTITRWQFSEDGRQLTGVVQTPSSFRTGTTSPPARATATGIVGDIPISRRKFLLFRYDPKRNNPEGISPLAGCYIPWKVKTIIEEYEAVGVAKDLGGVPVVGIDIDFMSKALADPTSSEAMILDRLQDDAANLHSGEKTHIIVPLAYTESGKELFNFKLVGVEGGGKQYNTDDIIKRKQNEILMLYLADVLKLGNDSVGSFALSESKNALLALAIEHHLKIISTVINSDLVPQTLALNGFLGLSEEEIPRLVHKDLDQVDIDNLSKFIQRVASTSMLPQTPEIINEILEKAAFEFRLDTDTPLDPNMFPAMQSRAGDGMQQAGEGTSNGGASPTDSSTGNSENA